MNDLPDSILVRRVTVAFKRVANDWVGRGVKLTEATKRALVYEISEAVRKALEGYDLPIPTGIYARDIDHLDDVPPHAELYVEGFAARIKRGPPWDQSSIDLVVEPIRPRWRVNGIVDLGPAHLPEG